MSGIAQFIASIGFGMAELSVSVDQTEHPRGSEITGTVVLRGGIAPQRIEHVDLELVAYQPGSSNTTSLTGLVVASRIDLVGRTPHAFPFRMRIPDNAELSAGWSITGHPRSGCRLNGRAYISWAADPRVRLYLDVTIHREIKAVQGAMRRLGFREHTPTPGFTVWKLPPPTGCLTYYLPPTSLKDQLEEVILSLEVNDGQVKGDLRLRAHESALAERIKAMLTARHITFPLEFESRELLTDQGSPKSDGALPRLKEILEEAVVLPNNEKNRLLRAAEAPTQETLLRPVTGNRRQRDEELLRPAEESE